MHSPDPAVDTVRIISLASRLKILFSTVLSPVVIIVRETMAKYVSLKLREHTSCTNEYAYRVRMRLKHRISTGAFIHLSFTNQNT